ncbi:lipid-A-disaccharide synthase N-terminal domain-containing protein [Dyella sp.]|uniref:lipid-A-disaccharide synthase N-terminal domain-containing protein n=1 Tax=Dyella sp. TaxID=1869338 RepID=UPI002D784C64|nr:lipid-A-disaccharide synthase N-terminal domain-containing protein [Dyella sp.]HET7330944.1 lipid-A-disaccharide synthase N-terminal domain-containing protein [Dyella sp.]
MGSFNNAWLALGLIGQTVFSGRFLLQWLYSEYKRRSVIPLAFWYASIIGALLLLCYACYKKDPVFIVGQASGLLIYVRNLQMRKRDKKEPAAESELAS